MTPETRDFPQSADAVLGTLTELFRLQGNQQVVRILENASARIEETGYDNWDGGQYLFTLFLEVPLKVFAPIEPELSKIETAIAAKLASVSRNTGDCFLRHVNIGPVLEQPVRTAQRKVPPVDSEHLWVKGTFRLFLSHVSIHKVAVSELKGELRKLGVSSFVAHEDIEPTLEWQEEIDLALRSMDGFAALLTPEFHESRWTDQEIGFALARGIPVIPVRLGMDPYGFIGKIQGLPGRFDAPAALASNLVDLIQKDKRTTSTMAEALVVALETAGSFLAAKAVVGKIEKQPSFTPEQLARMEVASKKNSQVSGSFGVPSRIQTVLTWFKPAPQDDGDF